MFGALFKSKLPYDLWHNDAWCLCVLHKLAVRWIHMGLGSVYTCVDSTFPQHTTKHPIISGHLQWIILTKALFRFLQSNAFFFYWKYTFYRTFDCIVVDSYINICCCLNALNMTNFMWHRVRFGMFVALKILLLFQLHVFFAHFLAHFTQYPWQTFICFIYIYFVFCTRWIVLWLLSIFCSDAKCVRVCVFAHCHFACVSSCSLSYFWLCTFLLPDTMNLSWAKFYGRHLWFSLFYHTIFVFLVLYICICVVYLFLLSLKYKEELVLPVDTIRI